MLPAASRVGPELHRDLPVFKGHSMRDALLGRKPCRTSKAVALEGISPEVGVADPAVQRVLPPHAVTPPRRPEPADPAHNHAQERSDVGHVAIDAQINGDASEWRGRAAARRSAPAVVADARRLVAPARGVPYARSKS